MDIRIMENPELYVEALIFASEQSIRIEEITYCLQAAFEHDFAIEEVAQFLSGIKEKYNSESLAIELVNISNGYQFLTKKKPIIRLSVFCNYSGQKRN